MKLALASLSLLSLFSSIANANTYGLGKSWLIGQGSTSNIQKVTATLNPGFPPTDQTGSLKLYPGLSNGTGDLLTTSVESWPDQSWCGGSANQWCEAKSDKNGLGLVTNGTSRLGIFNCRCIRTQVFSRQRPTFGQFAPLNANESLTIVFERSSNGASWTQSAIVNDQVVSQLSSSSGPMTLFGVTTECNDNCSMTVSPQIYDDITIELTASDLSWNSTAVNGSQVYGGEGATDISGQGPTVVTGLSSRDGQVWTVGQVMIPAFH